MRIGVKNKWYIFMYYFELYGKKIGWRDFVWLWKLYEIDFLYYLLNEMGELNIRKLKDFVWLIDDLVIFLENLRKKMKYLIFLFKMFNN